MSWPLALAKLDPDLFAFGLAFVSAFDGAGGFARLFADCAGAIAAIYVTVFPFFVWLLIALRNFDA